MGSALKNLKSLIEIKGSIDIAEFMNEAMFNPLYGYYRKKKPIGKNQDFITSPEISSVFGELIASYFFSIISTSKKSEIAFLEMGAGNGTLFFDIITTFKKISKKIDKGAEILDKIKFNIVEISEELTKIQKEKLKDFDHKISWFQNFDQFLSANKNHEIYFVANELFDCFPIHQFKKINDLWHEIVIVEKNEKLEFAIENFDQIKHNLVKKIINDSDNDTNSHAQLMRAPLCGDPHKLYNFKKHAQLMRAPLCGDPQQSDNFKKNDMIDIHSQNIDNIFFEYSFIATNFMQRLCECLKNQGGMALIIDYGYFNSSSQNTLQALKNHQFSNPLENIAESDLTALVNFKKLEQIAKQNSLNSSFLTQREFLLSLGILEKSKSAINNSTQINLAINRLIDEKQMGELFKCLIVWA